METTSMWNTLTKKLLFITIFLVPLVSLGQIFNQSQEIIKPYGGVIYATSTSGVSKLSATSSPTVGFITATSTTNTSLFRGSLQIDGTFTLSPQTSGRAQFGSTGILTSLGTNCVTSVGSFFGESWKLNVDPFGVSALSPTTTVPIWVSSIATSSIGRIQSTGISGGAFITASTSIIGVVHATSTTATSTFAGGITVDSLTSDKSVLLTSVTGCNGTSVLGTNTA